MEADCAMCHSLAFDRVGGTIRTLRHGEPEQVVADLRDFYRSRSPAPRAGATRRRPGQVGRAFGSVGAVQAIRAVFSQGGACYECNQVVAPPPGSPAFDLRPAPFPVRFHTKGWFDNTTNEAED